jgi:23S rRNA (cytosine1962-C5)-methyltransferase
MSPRKPKSPTRQRRPSAARRPPERRPPELRRGTLRVRPEAAVRLRAGHPWVFRDALGRRTEATEEAGEIVTLADPEGRFIGAGYYETDGAVAVKILSTDPERPPGPALYAVRAAEAVRLRERLLRDDTTAYRVINGEGDGLPGLTVDRYGNYLVGQLFSLAAAPLAEAVYPVLQERLGARAVYEQQRLRPAAGEARPKADLMAGKAAPLEVEVTEHGRRFLVDPSAPLGVGLFPDLREARHWLAERCAGLRVLNAFSYTGAFTVHLACAGAEVTAVDRSAKAHAWSRKNLKLNGLDPETACHHVTADATVALSKLAAVGTRFDLAILDPPSFSRSKKGSFSTARDYTDLLRQTLPLVVPGGLVLAVSNTARLSDEEFARALGTGAARAGREVRTVRRFPLPPDFPVPPAFNEGNYLKALLLSV